MDISIVSGTYNRLNYLKKMVESARKSLGDLHGLRHEFVLVDGGSQDGTQEWCRSQQDIRLIEHGRLLGAVKAFNDGGFAAQGTYVVLANDDIEFIGDTIWRGFVYMQEHKDCGIGCFFQDRNNLDWHVDVMPCVRDDRQVHDYYGQVCIVPKWLGDSVGWWGDYLHTYGGDNEISARVWELGFKVSPVPGTKVHDNEADDDLRKINNITGGKDPRAVRGHHPDSWAWGRRWRNHAKNLVGPVIKDRPQLDNPLNRRERILYLPIFEQGWAIQKQQKRGLREALAKVGIVREFDYLESNAADGKDGMMRRLREICHILHPTLVLTQIHNGAVINGGDVLSLRHNAPLAKFVNWNGDFWPENLLSADGVALARSFDLQTTVNRDVLEKYRGMGINAEYWQIGWEPDGVGHEPNEHDDVVFLATGYSEPRQDLVRRIRKLGGFSFGLWGAGWPKGWSKGECMYDFVTACRIYRGARISLGDSQWPESGFVSNRVMQALAAGGSALAHQYFKDMDKLGLIDGQTVIIWKDFSELRDKLDYYLTHEDQRRRIADAGQSLAFERHSFDVRVRELFDMMGKSSEEHERGWRW